MQVKVDPKAAAARRQDGQHVVPCKRPAKLARTPEQWRAEHLLRTSPDIALSYAFYGERCFYRGKLWRVDACEAGVIRLVSLQRLPSIAVSEDTRVCLF